MREQALSGFLALRECPNGPEKRHVGSEAALWSRREAVGPALFGNLRCVALGNSPGARRIHDQRAPAGNQPFVIGGVVPRRYVRRQESDQLLVIFERLPNLVGLDGEVSLGVDK